MIRRLFRRAPPDIDASLWRALRRDIPLLAALDDARADRLRGLAARFLHEKTITPLAGLALDDAQRATLAALCCLPLLEFGGEGLHGWSQVLVYPDAFRVDRRHVDAAGVMHEWQDELAGESWEYGPLVLSWADVASDLATPREGYCVAVHEMVHKLDALDGALDGTPPRRATGNASGRGISSRPTTRSRRASTAARTPPSIPMPPRRRKSSSRSAANTTSATPPCWSTSCRWWPRTSGACTAPLRSPPAANAAQSPGGSLTRKRVPPSSGEGPTSSSPR